MINKIATTIVVLFLMCNHAFAQTVIFSDDFESGVLNPTFWKASLGEPSGIVEVQLETHAVHEGFYGVAMGKNSDGEAAINALDLHLDLSAHQQVELRFWFKEHYENTNIQDGILFSDDGGVNFQKVYDFDFDNWNDMVWEQLPPIDVDQLANENGLTLTNQFVIRFQQHGSGDFDTYGDKDGIFLDDILVTSPVITYATLPFQEDFETGKLNTAWTWSNPKLTTEPETIRPSGFVDIAEREAGIAYSGFYELMIGRRFDGLPTTNALDLHLDLSGQSQVELRFWLKEHYDHTNIQDGIWFSDSGGTNFKKVYSFDFNNWNDMVWGQLPPIDVDQLALENGLNLTSQFVIRFQQYGSGDFDTYNEADGIFLDNISVTSPKVTYATLPFQDGFEEGKLNSAWTWSDPKLTTEPDTIRPFGLVKVVNTAPHDGMWNVVIGRRNDGQVTTNALDLHLDLSGQNQVELRFWFKEHYENTNIQDGIWFSDNGGTNFKKVYGFNFNDWNDMVWGQLPPIDIDQLAIENGLNLTSQFVIRFQQYGSGDFDTYNEADGIFLDDISVTSPKVTYATLPFQDGFEEGKLNSAWTWSNPKLTTEPNTIRPAGFIEVVNVKPHDGMWNVAIGRRYDGQMTTNALDLHLDLSGYEQVELNFWVKDFYDETNPQDGLWFSNDGGITFKHVYGFDFSNFPDLEWQNISIDVATLASENGLALTHQFVIRFQQYGSGDFDTGGDEDGIDLDDISVTGTPALPGPKSCAGEAIYNPDTGIVTIPGIRIGNDVNISNECYAVELQQEPPMEAFIFKLIPDSIKPAVVKSEE